MDKWSQLSMSDRAQLIKLFVRNGVTSLDDIRSQYNTFQDGGPRKTFDQWKQEMGQKYPWLELNSNSAGYDYERYFNENYDDAVARLSDSQPRHFTDKYKLPNHPTFSNESIYSRGPSYGGTWDQNDQFTPSIINRQQYPNIYKEYRPYSEEEIYSKKYASGGLLDGPDDPPDAISGPDHMLDPIQFLNSYVQSKAFESRAPSQWYIDKARKNIENFDRVHTPSTDNWFQRQITNYSSPHQNGNSIYTVDGDYEFALPAHNYARSGIFPKNDIVAHEYGHIIDPKKNITDFGILGSEQYLGLTDDYKSAFEGSSGVRDYFTKDGTELNRHDRSQVEKYADLQALRYKLYSKGIYDIRRDGEFNSNHYNAAIKYIKNDRLLDIYNMEEIIKLMNTIADNGANQQDVNIFDFPMT